MIQFFRKIRQRLLSENRFTKYLVYALGEIILVMIGILLALQVNNWNDNRIAKKNSKVFLEEMLLDLAIDTAYINSTIKKTERQLVYQESALSRIKHSLSDLDSVEIAYDGTYRDFYITDRTFKKIQNSANSKLVGFDSLYKFISNYYTFRKSRMQKNTEFEIKLSDDYSEVWKKFGTSTENPNTVFTKIIDGKRIHNTFPALTTKKQVDEFYLNFSNSIKGRNTLRQLYSRRLFSLRGFKDCKLEADALIASITKALNND